MTSENITNSYQNITVTENVQSVHRSCNTSFHQSLSLPAFLHSFVDVNWFLK